MDLQRNGLIRQGIHLVCKAQELKRQQHWLLASLCLGISESACQLVSLIYATCKTTSQPLSWWLHV